MLGPSLSSDDLGEPIAVTEAQLDAAAQVTTAPPFYQSVPALLARATSKERVRNESITNAPLLIEQMPNQHLVTL